jgi:hypothetical protein
MSRHWLTREFYGKRLRVCAEDLSGSIFTSLGEGKQKARTVSRSRWN